MVIMHQIGGQSRLR